jgi:thiamine biosynthesis lipoprotein
MSGVLRLTHHAPRLAFHASRLCALVFAIGLFLLAGCRSATPPSALKRFEFTSPHMGTLFSVSLYAPDQTAAKAAAQAAFRRVNQLEDILSDYQADSELMRLCEQPAGRPVPVSADLFTVLERAQGISEISHGAFDVTVGPYVRLWRFARKKKVLPATDQLASAAASVGYKKLRLDARAHTATLLVPDMRLDLGGIAKGYAADEALKILKRRGIDRALVAASGDIAIGAPPPGQTGWKIGISGIDDLTNGIARTVLLRNAGISTSGDTEQFIEIEGTRYSHILDPMTGLGLTNRIQATLIARDATITDGLGTAICVLGARRGLALVDSLPQVAAVILTKDGDRQQAFVSRRFNQTAKRPGRD